MKPVLICGSVAYDRIMDFAGNFSEHFMKDKLHAINVSFFVSPPKEEFGGTGGNIAYGLSLLGARADVAATVGTDFPRYEAWMKERGVGTALLAQREDLPSASGYIMTDQADNQIAAFSGGASMNEHTGMLPYADYDFVIVSPTNRDDMVRVAREAKERGVPMLFDPGQQIPMLSGEELRTAIEGAFGVIMNDYELALVSEKTDWSEKDMAERAGFLVVTLGAEGSRIVTKSGEERIAAVPAQKIVDPTGAGDAFRSGFIRGLLAKLPFPASLKLGATVAAYAVECYGTQNHTFTIAELSARYEDAYKEPFPL